MSHTTSIYTHLRLYREVSKRPHLESKRSVVSNSYNTFCVCLYAAGNETLAQVCVGEGGEEGGREGGRVANKIKDTLLVRTQSNSQTPL